MNRFLSNSPLGAADVAPLAANATLALGSVTPPSTAATAADQTQWVPDAANPTTGYPISGTSQIIVSECYATANAATSVVSFLNDHYTNATYTSIIRGNGFDTVPAAYATAIGNDFLTNNSGFGLNISNGGHVGDCHTFAGR